MAATKSRTAIWTAQSATATATSSYVDLSAAYGAQVNIRITNGGTALTTAPVVQVLTANNYNAGTPTLPVNFGGGFQGGATASAVYYLSVEIPFGVAAVALSITTAANVAATIDADVSIVTAV